MARPQKFKNAINMSNSAVSLFDNGKYSSNGHTIALLILLIGCSPPHDPIHVIDGVVYVRYTVTKEDTPGTVAGHLASTTYTLSSKHPNADRIEYNIYWSSLGPDPHSGIVHVNADEYSYSTEHQSAANYKEKTVPDYKVAIYDACTQLALQCTLEQIQEILKHKRSNNYRKGIYGFPKRK